MADLLKWFRDSRPEIWRKLAQELGASYQERT